MRISEQIISFLEKVSRPASPFEIAGELGLNANSVRPALSRLLDQGLIRRPFRGYYCTEPTHGVGLVPPRFQNLRVFVRDVPVRLEHKGPPREGYKEPIQVGDLSITIQFGFKRKRITYEVATSRGLDLEGFQLTHRLVQERLARMGYDTEGWTWWLMGEVFWDYLGVRLEGMKCITWDDFNGTMEKIYSKGQSTRREISFSNPVVVHEIESVITGGMVQNQIMQGLGLLVTKIDRLTDAVGFMARNYQAFQEGFFRHLKEWDRRG